MTRGGGGVCVAQGETGLPDESHAGGFERREAAAPKRLPTVRAAVVSSGVQPRGSPSGVAPLDGRDAEARWSTQCNARFTARAMPRLRLRFGESACSQGGRGIAARATAWRQEVVRQGEAMIEGRMPISWSAIQVLHEPDLERHCMR